MATKKSASKSTKSTKDVKSTKTAKPVSKANVTNHKSTKATTAKSTPVSTKTAPAKPKKETGRIVACIIGVIAVVVLVIIGVYALASNMDGGKNSLTVKDGDGNKITTSYVAFNDANFRLKIPTDFKALSVKEIEQKYGKQNAPVSAYTNENKDAYIAIAPTDNKLANDQIETYFNTMKTSFELVAEVVDSKYYTTGSHNIADIEFVTGDDYSNTIFFSQDNKLVTIIFECKDSSRKKWQPVGKFIMDSIDFTK